MRTFGICASLFAAAQLLIVSSPAYAQGGDAAPAKADAPVDTQTSSDVKPDAKVDTKAEYTKVDDKPAAPADGNVEVHIDSPQAVSLEKRESGSQKWEFVCTSPCDQRQSVGFEYRIVGTDLNESHPFTLDGSAGKVVLKVTPGVHNKAETGKWILIGGGVLAVGGVLVLILGSSAKADSTGVINQANSNTIFLGSTMLLAGLGGAVFGGSWFVNNSHTGVDGDIMRTTNEKPAPGGAPGGVKGEFKLSTSNKVDAPSRTPVYNTPKTSGLPAFLSVPVFGTTF